VRVVCRNRFDDGDTVEVLSPRTPVRECTVRNLIWHAAPETDLTDILRDNLGTVVGPDPEVVHGRLLRVGIANRTMEEYSFDVPFRLQECDIVRISRDTSAIICENGPSPFA
jgi:putative protease